MSTSEDANMLGTLNSLYKADSAYLRAGGGGFTAIAATLDPECVIYQPVSPPYGGVWRGHSGFEEWMRSFTQVGGSLEVREPEQMLPGNVVIGRSHIYAERRGSGQKPEWPLFAILQVSPEPACGTLAVLLGYSHTDRSVAKGRACLKKGHRDRSLRLFTKQRKGICRPRRPAKRRFENIAATLDPPVILHQSPDLPFGGEYIGHEQHEQWAIAMTSIFDNSSGRAAVV